MGYGNAMPLFRYQKLSEAIGSYRKLFVNHIYLVIGVLSASRCVNKLNAGTANTFPNTRKLKADLDNGFNLAPPLISQNSSPYSVVNLAGFHCGCNSIF